MNDRELLELAARAAGRSVKRWTTDSDGADVAELDDGQYFQPLHTNKLTDCMGDALRLSVTMSIELRFHLAGAIPSVTATVVADSRLPVCREVWGFDKGAATRRVIVRAAAEIGKGMKE